jgi:hypothetical protein
MKRIVAVVLVVLMGIALSACNPSNMALWKKQRDTGYSGGVVREVTVYNTITGEVVFQRTGKCFIEDDAVVGDFMILWTEDNTKTDFLGRWLALVAVEVKR